MIGVGVGVTHNRGRGGLPLLPEGFAFVVDDQGRYYIDPSGRYYIIEV